MGLNCGGDLLMAIYAVGSETFKPVTYNIDDKNTVIYIGCFRPGVMKAAQKDHLGGYVVSDMLRSAAKKVWGDLSG